MATRNQCVCERFFGNDFFVLKNFGTSGDAQQRIEDHLSGKQHIGYSKLRKAVEEIHQQRKTDREKDQDRRRGGDYR